jgi:hypothetical protein
MSCLVYLNGTTDYIEVYAYFSVAATTSTDAERTYFQGTLLRGGYSPPLGGPAFRATMSAAQSLTASTWTKINFDTEEFDTNNCYDTTNKRFQPNVAGYYQINAIVKSGSQNRQAITSLYKNGTIYARGSGVSLANTTSQTSHSSIVTDIVYLNGSTDYVEAYIVFTTASSTDTDAATAYFSGHFVRGE